MPVLRLVNFGGTIPMLGNRALPDGFATESINTWFYGNEMRGIRVQKDLLPTVPHTTQKVFRIPKGTIGGNPYDPGFPPPSYVGDDKWVLLPHKDTDIVGSSMANDEWDRWYFCDPINGPYWNTKARLLAGNPMYVLGANGPPAEGGAYTPTMSAATGGTGSVIETRAYLYTWVNEYNEETHPSLPVQGSYLNNATWHIANILDPPDPLQPAPPAGMVYPAWKHKNLFRTVVSASGIVNYFKVAEVPLTTGFYADSKLTSEVVGELPLESTTWRRPPKLEGFVSMPNGFLIGFMGKDIYMSESYQYHAWPEEYKHTEEFQIVGLGQVDNTCVVCTEGHPDSISGMKPAIMSFNKSNSHEPCLSRGSIVSTPTGVIYASPNGLMSLGPQGFANVTEKIITKTKWQQAFVPAYLRGVRYGQGYLGLRDVPPIDPDYPDGPKRSMFYLDPSDLKVALTEFQLYDRTQNIQSDMFSGEIFLITDNDNEIDTSIQMWDPTSPWEKDVWKPVRWKSKEYQFQYKENFSAYAIYWDDERFTTNDDCDHIMPPDEHVHFKVWADRQLIYDETVPVNGRPVRLPSGFKSDIWQFEVKARAPVYSVHVASTVKELKGV